jgi:hypothetical protein
MGSAYFVVLEKDIDGLDAMMDGKSLARHIEELDEAALRCGVSPLSEFVSMPPEELAEFLDDSEGVELPPLKNFSADDGLITVKALLAHQPPLAGNVVADLRQCERILTAAQQHATGWHFQIDV